MNKKYLILGGVLIAIAGVGYLLYKKFVTDKVTKMATEVDQDITQAEAMAMAQAESMSSATKPDKVITSSSGYPVIAYTPSGAPLTNQQLFQQYMNR
jgi:type IV secretory pathway TrbF-like protein